jgi:hypothetical protein
VISFVLILGCRLCSDGLFEYNISPLGSFDMTSVEKTLSFAVILCRIFYTSNQLLSLSKSPIHVASSSKIIEPFTNMSKSNEFDPQEQFEDEEKHDKEEEEAEEMNANQNDDNPDQKPVVQLSLPDQPSPIILSNIPEEQEEPISTPIRDQQQKQNQQYQFPLEIPGELINNGKGVLKPDTVLKCKPSGRLISVGPRFFPGGCNAGMYFASRTTSLITRRVNSTPSLIIKTASTRPCDENGVPREVSVLQAFPTHPNIVPMVDWSLLNEGKSYAIVMPRLHSELPRLADDIAICARDLMAALDHLHSHNVMHRDVKQTNVLYNPVEKRAVLIDFDCSKVIVTGVGVATDVGTRRYKAPEVVNGVNYDFNIDVWSAGVVLAEWILHEDVTNMDTGQPSGVPHQVRYSLMRRMRDAMPNLSRKEQDLVIMSQRMMTISPQRRPSSHSLLPILQALHSTLDDSQITTIPILTTTSSTTVPTSFSMNTEGIANRNDEKSFPPKSLVIDNRKNNGNNNNNKINRQINGAHNNKQNEQNCNVM